MKLELKHLAPYLPYGLKYQEVKIYNNGEIYTLDINSLFHDFKYFESGNCKPILRPLSELTNEIEVNCLKFVPLELLNNEFRKLSKDLMPYKWEDNNLELDIETENYSQTINLFDGHLITNKLFEWHFDVFGLIEKELAIDINTL